MMIDLSALRNLYMENERATYQKYLTLQELYTIEDGLNQSLTLKHIAQQTGKDPSTISKEIRQHRIPESSYGPTVNDYIYRKKCQKHNLSMSCHAHLKCSSCRNADCRTLCKDTALVSAYKQYEPLMGVMLFM